MTKNAAFKGTGLATFGHLSETLEWVYLKGMGGLEPVPFFTEFQLEMILSMFEGTNIPAPHELDPAHYHDTCKAASRCKACVEHEKLIDQTFDWLERFDFAAKNVDALVKDLEEWGLA